ncbi:MAG: peptidoglycan-binding domain-containing protein [Candidatus Omnitrophota bacterium]
MIAAVVLCLSGCGKDEPISSSGLNVDVLSVAEADSLIGNIVVNAEAEPLVVQKESMVDAPQDSRSFPDAIAVQTALKNLGLYAGKIDGKIGPKTKAAVREFQRQNQLVADGKVGPKTWAVLKE